MPIQILDVTWRHQDSKKSWSEQSVAAEERGAAHGCCKLNVRGASDPPAQLIREFVSWFQIIGVLSKFLMGQEFENQILDAEPNS